jgi:putative transposase
MSERKISFSSDEFYHIFNRGVDKRKIFLSSIDYARFTALLYFCNSENAVKLHDLFPQGIPLRELENLVKFDRGESIVNIGAYCLMPNHFHLLLKEKTEGGITKFMSKLLTAYSMYFNKKHERKGKLFQGFFGAEHLNTDEYLKYIFAYIHLNPIKLINHCQKEKRIVNKKLFKKFLENYKYSSYVDYCGGVSCGGFVLTKKAFPMYFLDSKEFSNFIDDCISARESLAEK